jgi:[acyl-carrier-protein] S-malonyltransferase
MVHKQFQILSVKGCILMLNKTILQPAIYVTSLAAVEVLRAREEGQSVIDSIDVTCGLSLGEYTALAFAGAFRYFSCSVNGIMHFLF